MTIPVTVSRDGLHLADRYLPIYSGTVHYWRLDPELWRPVLENVRALGFEMIETYIPWGVHEIERGAFDFGQDDPYKDLPRFLKICHELDISVCVRPGPHINAELTWFGFPLRVLQDPDVWAYTGNGAPAVTDRLPQPFAVPSYASEKLFAETALFFDALCPILVEHSAPNGAVVACQVDNETCYFFRNQPYDMDYAADSLRLYRRMLRENYGTIDAINAAYGKTYPDFDAVEPPRDFEAMGRQDVPRLLDWAAYKEYQITTALERIGTMFRERGITVPLYHDVAFQITTPIDVNALQAQPHLDFVGTNLYANQEEYHTTIAPRVRYQAGTQKLPFVPEYGAGLWWFHDRTFSPQEQEFFVLAGLMHGLRALNFYMLVERDRWQGSPITRDNRLRPGYADFFQKLSGLVRDTGLLRLDKMCSILVLQNYELNRYTLAATSLNDAWLGFIGVPSSLAALDAKLDFAHDPAVVGNIAHHGSWLRGVIERVEAAQIEYDLSDTHAPLTTLERYPLVFVPSADFMATEEQQHLLEYAQNGGHLVIGPTIPTLDRTMQPSDCFPALREGTTVVGKGTITLLPNADLLPLNMMAAHVNAIRHDNAALRITVRGNLCFVANPTNAPQHTTLQSANTLRGVWNASGDYANDALTIPPYTIQIWEIVQ
jgi:beta-galactosidase